MSLSGMLADLPRHCAVSTKRNAKGYKTSWTGCKLHLDVADGGPDTDWPRRFDTTRATAERVNGRLKDDFGGRNVRVRSHDKVMCT